MAFVSSPILVSSVAHHRATAPRRARFTAVAVKPMADKVIVRVHESATESAGGLFLGADAQEKQKTGTVVAVGPGRYSPSGVREQIFLEEGDQVLWKDEYGAETIESEEDGDFLALRVFSILGKY